MTNPNGLKKGQILHAGKYRIEEILGSGSFGITYLATAKLTTHGNLGAMDVEAKVAIKEFFMSEVNARKEDGSTVEGSAGTVFINYRQKFRKEAENLSKLAHPNIVEVFDVFDENNTTYYVMKFIEGQNLDDYIKQKGHLNEQEAISIVNEVGSALVYMHAQHMLHLDIKPKNIMRATDGKYYIIDFGLSKQFSDSGEPESSTSIGLGTPGYAPIEQTEYHKDGGFPATLDVYALAATLFKMLTGERPPEATYILNDGFPSERLNSLGVALQTAKAIEKGMAPMRKQRYQTVKVFLKGLIKPDVEEDTIVSEPVKQTSHQSIDQDVLTKKSKTGLYVWSAIILCMVVGLGVYFSTNECNHYDTMEEDMTDSIPEEDITDSIQDVDTATAEIIEQIPQISVHQLSKSVGKSSLKVDFPKCSNDVLQNSIIEWINEQLGGTYEGDLNNNEALFNHYASKLRSINEGHGEYSKTTLTKVYEDDYVVTYQDDSEVYGGGVHEIGFVLGKTFRKSDGKAFSNSFITFYKIKDQAIRGLKNYFGVSTDDELLKRLQIEGSSLDQLPPPSSDPWIMGDGVHFLYTPYEIACFADGSPTFTISIENIKPAVNATAKTFFD